MSAKERGETGRLRVGVSGAAGRMGRVTCGTVVADYDLILAAAIDPVFVDAGRGKVDTAAAAPRFAALGEALAAGDLDVIVDFTVPAAVKGNVLLCVENKVPVVVGTTGLSTADLAEIEGRADAARVPVLVAPNFALGAVLMMRFAEEAAKHFGACEIVELHHADKIDAPSGTARLTQRRVEDVWREVGEGREVAVHSVRLPGLVAHQVVIFGGQGETLTIRHDSLSRESFMSGVILAIKRVRELQGLVVGLENIL
ncbi:MAG: 4-hydroxy-tetrahydrodipicolinate reductase [Acidobacteria bacterium RBG_16_64_8]|nr:MAG: 4-hydroxy-tetrahydrodipicolinate reductase [Acidobacteria bacterium RBG_16_64_8]